MPEAVEAAALGSRFFLAFVFVASALPKLVAGEEFRAAVANYRLAPPRIGDWVALSVPWVELGCGAALFAGLLTRWAALVACAMLVIFIGSVTINLARGRTIECGCTGSVVPSQIGLPLLARDTSLLAMSLLVVDRSPTTLTLDGVWAARPHLLSTEDALAVLAVASLVALVEALVRDTRRLVGAAGSATRTHDEVVRT